MPNVTICRIVVASPEDVQPERDALPAVVAEINQGIAAEHGLRLELARWETDAYPGFHPEGPQGLIDTILRIEDCDILIGIFWKRFGTPVQGANSGTEHEFRRAYEAWQRTRRPHIMVYFIKDPTNLRPRRKRTSGARFWNSSIISPRRGSGGPTRANRNLRGLSVST